MRIRSAKTLVVSGLVVGFAAVAIADVLISTGFEGSAYTPNQLLDGQDGWVTVLARDAIYVSDTGANHGQKCAKILGDKLVHSNGLVWKATCGRFLNYDPVLQGTPVVHLRVSAKLTGPLITRGPGDGMSAVFYTATVAGENLGSLSVASDGVIYATAFDGRTTLATAPYAMGTYADLELRLDFNAFTTTYIANGTELVTAPMRPGPLQSTELIAMALQMDGLRDRDNPQDWGKYAAFFDDYSVSAGQD